MDSAAPQRLMPKFMGWFDRFKKQNLNKSGGQSTDAVEKSEKQPPRPMSASMLPKPESPKSASQDRETEKAAPPLAKKPHRSFEPTAFRVILRPHVTEKAARLQAMNQFIFEVPMSTNKRQVAQAMLELYGARPTSVNVVKIPSKRVNSGRISGVRGERKKVIVTFASGQTINVFQEV